MQELGPAQLGKNLSIKVEGRIIIYARPVTSCNCQRDLFKNSLNVIRGKARETIGTPAQCLYELRKDKGFQMDAQVSAIRFLGEVDLPKMQRNVVIVLA